MTRTTRFALVVVAVAAVFVVGIASSRYVAAAPETAAPETAAPETAALKLEWQSVPESGGLQYTSTYRARVPGGWLVAVGHHRRETVSRQQGAGLGIGMSAGVTFVPDPDHQWR